MVSLEITGKDGDTTVEEFDQDQVTIGRDDSNDIVLRRSNISKRHARIVLKNGTLYIVDNQSTNGTGVNGRRITKPYPLKPSDKVMIGDYTIIVSNGASAAAPPPPPSDEDSKPADDFAMPMGTAQGTATEARESSKSRPKSKSRKSPPPSPTEKPKKRKATTETLGDMDSDFDEAWDIEDLIDEEASVSVPSPASNEPSESRPKTTPAKESKPTTGSMTASLAALLREYVSADAAYREQLTGTDCSCGTCVLCKSRELLSEYDLTH